MTEMTSYSSPQPPLHSSHEKFAQADYFQPAEWQTQDACWLAWPGAADLWKENLKPAQKEFIDLCRIIGESERLEILVSNESDQKEAAKALEGLPIRFHSISYGDIWLRDTAPIFLAHPTGTIAVAKFGFNGWGQKYVLPYDAQVSNQIAKATQLKTFESSLILEGGSIEVDGQGTCLTTEQCLLNPNRNPGMSKAQIEKELRATLGVKTILWLKEGLLNDHTDGHIDTLARFVAPGKVVCMEARSSEDPNQKVLEEIIRDLESFHDAQGRKLEVIRIPSPGLLLNADDEVMPASYVNFYIANGSVIVPTYGLPQDQEAVRKIGECFPGRKTIGLSAKAILSGGGAFHCITQQQPQGVVL
jgi:agmatine deiminase